MVVEINVNTFRNISVFILSIAFISKIGLVRMPWYFPYVVSMPLFLALLIIFSKRKGSDLDAYYKVVFVNAILPYALAIIYSFMLRLNSKGIVNTAMRSISVTLQECYIVIFAIIMVSYFRDDVIEILINSVLISYLYSIILALWGIGIDGLITYSQTFWKYETKINRWFEMHDIGLTTGILLLYEVIFAPKKNWLKTCLLCFVFLFCYKRIAILSFVITIFLWLLTKNLHRLIRDVQISMYMLLVFACCVVYVMLISSGKLYVLASRMGIDFSNRRYLYSFVSKFYDWSVFFPGHGLGFTEKYLTSISNTSSGRAIRNMGNVHNDILKTYIDLGFIGSSLWFLWFIFRVPRELSKQLGGASARYVYCITTVYAYVIYTTDNASTYFIFQTVLFALIMYGGILGIAQEKQSKRCDESYDEIGKKAG